MNRKLKVTKPDGTAITITLRTRKCKHGFVCYSDHKGDRKTLTADLETEEKALDVGEEVVKTWWC